MLADKRRRAKQPSLAVGDKLLVRQQKRNKLTQFSPKPYTITNIKGAMITVQREKHQITRNCSHFKFVAGKSFVETSTCENEGEASLEDGVDQPSIEDAQERGGGEEVEEQREIEDPAFEHQESQRRYPQRRRYNPLFYKDEQHIT